MRVEQNEKSSLYKNQRGVRILIFAHLFFNARFKLNRWRILKYCRTIANFARFSQKNSFENDDSIMKKALMTLALGTFGLGVTEFAMMGILP